MGINTIESLVQYYAGIYPKAEREIGEQSENAILKMSADKVADSYCERFALPLLEKDTRRPIKTKKIQLISVEKDGWELILHRGETIQVSYPVKPSRRIEEVIQRCAQVESANIPFSVKYTPGYIQFEVGQDDIERAVNQLEENMRRRNSEVEAYNGNIKKYVMEYIINLKKALEQERSKPRKESPSKTKSKTGDYDDDDWDDDDDGGRTPNDDRSDTLNPNNPAYDDARDNRADQLNPNNPEYRGH